MQFDPKVTESLENLMTNLQTEFPEVTALLDKARAQEITFEEALLGLNRMAASDPVLSTRLLAVSLKHLQPLREDSIRPPEMIFQSGVGLPRMNPLLEGAIGERLQFDGDAPELRTGPLPPGARPAVPVRTQARNPIAVGQMLDAASNQVQGKVEAHQQKRQGEIEAVAEGIASTALMRKHGAFITKEGDFDVALALHGNAGTDHPSYRRGRLPAPVKVAVPSGKALANLTPQERREAAWRFLSTTQGRRTALGVIREGIAKELRAAGIEAVERDFNVTFASEVIPLAHHQWTVQVDNVGPNSTQPAFSFIDMAAKAISAGLLRAAPDPMVGKVFLEVVAVNTVDVRTVGWAARLVRDEPRQIRGAGEKN